MQKRSRNMSLVCGAILGLLVLACPFLSCMAQKAQDQKNQSGQEQSTAMEALQKSIVASIFYQSVRSQDSDWVLTKAGYTRGGSGNIVTDDGVVVGNEPIRSYLTLTKGKAKAWVIISEYPSEEAAKFPLRSPAVQQGEFHGCKGDECGDEGLKYYEGHNLEGVGMGFEGLHFRKGRFFVSISCNSEETAKRFAGYALIAVANR